MWTVSSTWEVCCPRMATAGQISTDASAWPHQLCLLCTTSGRTDRLATCLLVQKSVSTRLLSSQSYYMQQKPGPLLLPTSKLWKPSTWSVRDSCCRSAGNSLSEMMRSQRPPAWQVSISNGFRDIPPQTSCAHWHNPKSSLRMRGIMWCVPPM